MKTTAPAAVAASTTRTRLHRPAASSGLPGRIQSSLLAFALTLVAWGVPAASMADEGQAALAGLDAVKAVFLVNQGSPAATARYLKGVQATLSMLAEEGVKPSAVLVFLGKPVQYITTQPDESIAAEHGKELASIAESITGLQSLGARMEVCTAATRHFGVDNATLLPGMFTVPNGLVSLIGWQAKGYVPMTF